MDCKHAANLIDQYFDGEPLLEEQALFSHLSICEKCRAYFEDLQALQASLASLRPDVPPIDLSHVKSTGKIARSKRRRRILASCTSAAAALIVCFCLWTFLQTDASFEATGEVPMAAPQDAQVESCEEESGANAYDSGAGEAYAGGIAMDEEYEGAGDGAMPQENTTLWISYETAKSLYGALSPLDLGLSEFDESAGFSFTYDASTREAVTSILDGYALALPDVQSATIEIALQP